MSGLILKLGPKERILINSAVVENGDRRNRLAILTPNAHILRLKDAIHPGQVDTPVKRVCYGLQLVLSGDSAGDAVTPQLLKGLEQLSQVFRDDDSRAKLDQATTHLVSGNHYLALKALRALLPREERLFMLRS